MATPIKVLFCGGIADGSTLTLASRTSSLRMEFSDKDGSEIGAYTYDIHEIIVGGEVFHMAVTEGADVDAEIQKAMRVPA